MIKLIRNIIAIVLLLFVSCSVINHFEMVKYKKEVFGINLRTGNKVVDYHVWGGFQGDGTDVEIYSGNKTEYIKCNQYLLSQKFPLDNVNINKFHQSRKWKHLPIEGNDTTAINYALCAVNGIADVKLKQKAKYFIESQLLNDNCTFYAFNYKNGHVDLWVINLEKAIYARINLYT
jgi:hypothetical protein